ncbi:MAG: group I truncated hemoglobin [Methylocella sp.]
MRVFALATLATIAIAGASQAHAQTMQKSLYERLGGQPAIVAVVDDFVGNVAKDKRINGFFAHTDLTNLKAKLVEQICAGTGGPCTYTGGDMKTVHAGLGIRSRDFNALVGDLGKTLKKFKVPKKEQGELGRHPCANEERHRDALNQGAEKNARRASARRRAPKSSSCLSIIRSMSVNSVLAT